MQINGNAMIIKVVEILLLLAASVVSDIKTYKIKNFIIIPFTLAGIITNYIFDGSNGLGYAFAGWFIPVAVLFILYAARMIGAGDVKLFGAIGSIMGWKFSLYGMAYTFLLGGFIGIIMLAINRNAAERFNYLKTYLKACFLSLNILDYSNFQNKKDRFRLTYAVVPGVLLQMTIIFFIRS